MDEVPLVNKSPKKKRIESFPDDPPPTEWKYVCPCNFIPITKLVNTNRFFFRSIEIQLTSLTIVFVLLLIIFSLFSFFKIILPYLQGNLRIVSIITILLTSILFLWSYISAACSDPGFLPYDWYRTQNDWYTWEEQLSGLAINETQCVFVDMHKRPYNSSFSRSSGRFVIRADHICNWISNWVGKRNHKQFLLMMFWGMLYCVFMIVWSLFAKTSNMNDFERAIIYICNTLEIIFTFILIVHLFNALFLIFSNQTQLQVMKNQNPLETKSFIESLEEVCGNTYKIVWLCPISAFNKDLPIHVNSEE